ncbi:MAG: hypothetical protein ACE149_09325 [Armatimonadota bacterium]
MAYCPKCLSEYRPGVTRCSDCGESLVASDPAQSSDWGSMPDVVRLCETHVGEADIIRAALAEAGIQSMVQGHGPITAELTRLSDGATEDYAIIYVTSNRLEAAMAVLEELQSSDLQWPEGMEPDEPAGDEYA